MSRVEHTMNYAGASTEQVLTMLADPTFRAQVCEEQKVLSHEVAIDRAGEQMSVRIEQVQATEGVPGFAKKIVGDKTTVVQTETWTGPEAEVTVVIPGKPGTISGDVEIVEDATGARETVRLDITVSIPLVGRKLEGLLATLLSDALSAEERVGQRWLGGAR